MLATTSTYSLSTKYKVYWALDQGLGFVPHPSSNQLVAGLRGQCMSHPSVQKNV